MLNGLFPRRLRSHLPVALGAAALLALAACATSSPGPGIPQPDPTVIYHSLFGSNPGLSTVRAVVEARIAYAGRSISLPGVLLLDAFDGLRIVQLSDFHLYPFTKPELVRRAVQISSELAPDLVTLTGDYVWHEVDAIRDLLPILAELRAPYGVYGIMGNHEIWTDADAVG